MAVRSPAEEENGQDQSSAIAKRILGRLGAAPRKARGAAAMPARNCLREFINLFGITVTMSQSSAELKSALRFELFEQRNHAYSGVAPASEAQFVIGVRQVSHGYSGFARG